MKDTSNEIIYISRFDKQSRIRLFNADIYSYNRKRYVQECVGKSIVEAYRIVCRKAKDMGITSIMCIAVYEGMFSSRKLYHRPIGVWLERQSNISG